MRPRSVLLIVPWLLAFVLFVACDGQGEGQACTLLNGNADCQDGLVCKFVQGVNGDRCCPSSVSLSTTAVCGVQQNGNGADAAAPPLEAGVGEGGSEGGAGEAGDDASPSAVGDAAGDAAPGTDAPSE